MSASSSHINLKESVDRGHETTDADFKKVLLTGIGLLGIMVLGLLLSWAVYTYIKGYTAVPGSQAETLTRPDLNRRPLGPNLQSDPHAELVALRKVEDSVLLSYGWVNKDSGIVRIPIDRAMELLVKKGLPHREVGSKK